MVFEKSVALLDQLIASVQAGTPPTAAAPAAAPAAGGGAAAAGGAAPKNKGGDKKPQQAQQQKGGAPDKKPAAGGGAAQKKKGGAAAGEDSHGGAAEEADRPRAPLPEHGKVVVRFAPSPTGYLHIGGARTALFNYLYAKRHGGKFMLRIEDTDRARSTEDAVQAIYQGLRWLGLQWDGEPIMQFSRMHRHAEVALDLLAKGRAYKCFATPDELDQMRKEQEAAKLPPRYDGRWRDRDPATAPEGLGYVVRLRAPLDGATTLFDHVQGTVVVENKQMDDMVLLRSDGTPTYMLSVVVDDHDMGVTHVIRGVDHLTNTFRQLQLYEACGWTAPQFGHIPLIHGPDGKKLSKRHGATGAEQYQAMGYLPAGILNYLMRLGWSHGQQELFTMEEATAVFDLTNVHRSPANLNFDKLADINHHYIKLTNNDELFALLRPFLDKKLAEKGRGALTDVGGGRVLAAMEHLKTRAKTLETLADSAIFLAVDHPIDIEAASHKVLDKTILSALLPLLEAADPFDATNLDKIVRQYGTDTDQKMAKVSQPLRVAITGSAASPPLFELMVLLGRDISFTRIRQAIEKC